LCSLAVFVNLNIVRYQTELKSTMNLCLSYSKRKTHLFWVASYCHPRPVWLYHIFP